MITKARQLRIYSTESGKQPFNEWVKDLRDPPTVRRIQARLAGVIAGNLGDVKPVGDGVSELRIDYGPGYRLYYTIRRQVIVILLCGSAKIDQKRTMRRAKELAKTV